MARTRANILCDIWDDPDFIALPQDAQRLYLFLLSQRDLNHAGLVPMRLRRWASKMPGGTVGQVSKALGSLTKTGFVLADRDTEEVLIRTYVRNDGVFRQPKVMLRMREDARLMESVALKEAFVAELHKIPLDELSDKRGGANGDQESTRAIVARVIDDLIADLTPKTGRVSDTPGEGYREGYPIPPRAGAGALHLPPTTSHQPPDDSHLGGELSPERTEPWRCPKHQGQDVKCGACADARRSHEQAQIADAKATRAAKTESAKTAARLAATAIATCDLCGPDGRTKGGRVCPHQEAAPMPDTLRASLKGAKK